MKRFVELEGIEPSTYCMPCSRASQLRYSPIEFLLWACPFRGSPRNIVLTFAILEYKMVGVNKYCRSGGMADAVASKAIEGNLMGVQVPSPALNCTVDPKDSVPV